MRPILAGLAYSIAILLGFVGWGWLVTRHRKAPVTIGVMAALGVSVVLVAGGVFNALSIISPASTRTLLVIGWMLASLALLRWLLCARPNGATQRRWLTSRAGLGLVLIPGALIAFSLIQYCWVHGDLFNSHDDFQAYFVFPSKMLSLGSLGSDPFSERRLVSSLGGKYFLDSMVLADLGYPGLHVMDRCVGFLIFILITLELTSYFGLGERAAIVTLTIVAAWPTHTVNITAQFLGAALFMALFLKFRAHFDGREPDLALRNDAALLLSGLVLLKNTFIPAAAIVGLILSLEAWPRFLVFAKQVGLLSITILILIAPWVLSAHQAAGSGFFPLIAQGYHTSTYSEWVRVNPSAYLQSLAQALRTWSHPLFFLLGMISIHYIARWRARRGMAVLALGICACVVVFYVASAGSEHYRFVFPFVFPFIVYAGLDMFRGGRIDAFHFWRSRWGSGVLVLVVTFATGHFIFRRAYWEVRRVAKTVTGWEKWAADEQTVRGRYSALQGTVPVGATILERLDKPYLLDFRRNTIYVNDYPGGSSPPPGMPLFGGPGVLADYLAARGVDFIMYSHRSEAGYSKAKFGGRLTPGVNAFVYTQALHTFAFQDRVMEMRNTNDVISDDGDTFLIRVR